MRHPEVAIVIAAYNEEGVIQEVLTNLRQERPDDLIIVVDDGSKDNTYRAAASVEGVIVARHYVNLGQGAALQTGIEIARCLHAEYLVTFDADGQHDPADIGYFLEVMKKENLDIALGSRFLGETNAPLLKRVVLKLSTIFTWLVSRILLTDSHNGFRVIHIAKFPQFEIRQNRMAHASEIIDIIRQLKMRYKELPCHIRYTDYSKAKGQSISNSINIVLDYFIERFIL